MTQAAIFLFALFVSNGCRIVDPYGETPLFIGCADETPGESYDWSKLWIVVEGDGAPERHCIRTTSCVPGPARCSEADPFGNESTCIGTIPVSDGLALTSASTTTGACLIPCDPEDPAGCYYGACTFVESLDDPGFVCLP